MLLVDRARGTHASDRLLVDQAALNGLFKKVRDVTMPLLPVVCVRRCQAEATDVKKRMYDRIKVNLEETHESNYLHKIWTAGSASAQRG